MAKISKFQDWQEMPIYHGHCVLMRCRLICGETITYNHISTAGINFKLENLSIRLNIEQEIQIMQMNGIITIADIFFCTVCSFGYFSYRFLEKKYNYPHWNLFWKKTHLPIMRNVHLGVGGGAVYGSGEVGKKSKNWLTKN